MRRLLVDVASLADSGNEVAESCARDAADLLRRSPPLPRKPRGAPKRKREKLATRKEEMARVRRLVWIRSLGRCECDCGAVLSGPDAGELDHFRGGANRAAGTTTGNCWRLAPSCHRMKTLNRPSRDYWVTKFQWHCERNGITPPRGMPRANEKEK